MDKLAHYRALENIEVHNEHILLKRLSEGDEAAFSTLFHHYRDKIYTIAYGLSKSATTAEEIVQDVFMKIWLKRSSLAATTSFKDYLFIVTRNHVFNLLKRQAAHTALTDLLSQQDSASLPAPDTLMEHKAYRDLLQQAIAQLSPQQQQVYRLTKEQGLKREEVALRLGLSPETVKVHLAKAMRSIRAYCLSRIDIFTGLLLLYFEQRK